MGPHGQFLRASRTSYVPPNVGSQSRQNARRRQLAKAVAKYLDDRRCISSDESFQARAIGPSSMALAISNRKFANLRFQIWHLRLAVCNPEGHARAFHDSPDDC